MAAASCVDNFQAAWSYPQAKISQGSCTRHEKLDELVQFPGHGNNKIKNISISWLGLRDKDSQSTWKPRLIEHWDTNQHTYCFNIFFVPLSSLWLYVSGGCAFGECRTRSSHTFLSQLSAHNLLMWAQPIDQWIDSSIWRLNNQPNAKCC